MLFILNENNMIKKYQIRLDLDLNKIGLKITKFYYTTIAIRNFVLYIPCNQKEHYYNRYLPYLITNNCLFSAETAKWR